MQRYLSGERVPSLVLYLTNINNDSLAFPSLMTMFTQKGDDNVTTLHRTHIFLQFPFLMLSLSLEMGE